MNAAAENPSDSFVIQSISPSSPRILRATHLGMCFGVRDAIALARSESAKHPLTILGDLVHNETVMAELRSRGVQTANDPAAVATATAMITAHGASEKAIRAAQERGLHLLEATCPLVHHAHRAVQQLAAAGYHPIIIGQRGHVEVRGLTEDLAAFDIVLTAEEIAGLTERPRFGVASQTTQPIDRVRSLVEALRRRFPNSEIRFVDTVCQPTKQRQAAAMELARQCDVVIVQTCARHCARVHHIQDASDLRGEWFEGATTIGLTAGTSTPDCVIDAVEERLRRAF
jgi:4-hydroxy-3-methylbut-2-enyl diphosphate reductase